MQPCICIRKGFAYFLRHEIGFILLRIFNSIAQKPSKIKALIIFAQNYVKNFVNFYQLVNFLTIHTISCCFLNNQVKLRHRKRDTPFLKYLYLKSLFYSYYSAVTLQYSLGRPSNMSYLNFSSSNRTSCKSNPTSTPACLCAFTMSCFLPRW